MTNGKLYVAGLLALVPAVLGLPTVDLGVSVHIASLNVSN